MIWPCLVSLSLLFIMVPSTMRGEISYSKSTKKNMRSSALIGALEGSLSYAFFCYLDGARSLNDYKKYPVALGLSAAAGAAIGYFIGYCMSPEATLENVESEINAIKSHNFFAVLSLAGNNLVSRVEKALFQEKFPLAAAFVFYANSATRLEKCREKLESVLKMGNEELELSAVLLLEKVNSMYLVLQEACLKIRDDADFLNQCSALNIEDMKRAQQLAAQAAVLGALNRPVVIYN